jgi:hypothetical protein
MPVSPLLVGARRARRYNGDTYVRASDRVAIGQDTGAMPGLAQVAELLVQKAIVND